MQAQPNQTMRDINALKEFLPASAAAVIREYDAMGATLAEAGTFRRLGERPSSDRTGSRASMAVISFVFSSQRCYASTSPLRLA